MKRPNTRWSSGISLTVLLFIAQLYSVERTARERALRGEELRLLREHASPPVLERMHAYMLQIRDELAKPSPTHKRNCLDCDALPESASAFGGIRTRHEDH